ncbi:hypothetical protein [Polluticoccus soli]|uniref:hypothetical protein n=1 Tax=Polluticoccus soli TaxID=3034150 RepID=UPI0023E3013B|nr:hypothetical protein [Flavipsychrobacter sp. JY13-12]
MQIAELVNIIPADFSDNARVWIYQSNRPFSEKEENEINEQLYQFYTQWNSHGDPVKGWAKLLFKQFIVMMADETDVSVSGCSTDSSVRIIKSIERQYSVNLFDRMTLTFLVKDKAEMLPFGQVQYAIDKGFLTRDTLFFNNIAATRKELLNGWLIPLGESWLASRVSLPVTT